MHRILLRSFMAATATAAVLVVGTACTQPAPTTPGVPTTGPAPTTAAPTTTVPTPVSGCSPATTSTATAIVEFDPGTDAEARSAALDELGVTHAQAIGDDWYSVALDAEQTVGAMRSDAVHLPIASVEATGEVHPAGVAPAPTDPYFSAQWGLEQSNDVDIDARTAWGTTTANHGVIVAIVDSGVEITHPDFAANVWTNPGEIAGNAQDDDRNGVVDDVHGARFTNGVGGGDPRPDSALDDHGTLVAGVIAAGRNGVGVVGIAPDVTILPVKVLFNGSGTWVDVAAGIRYAADRGADVINVSLGSLDCNDAVYDSVAYARTKGSLVVAAAGNDGRNTRFYPASIDLDNVISVGSINPLGALSTFSNFGAAIVDIGAPGEDIVTTQMGAAYTSSGGTSLAAPYVAGTAALVAAKYPSWSAAQIRGRILTAADHDTRYATVFGSAGRLNAATAVG